MPFAAARTAEQTHRSDRSVRWRGRGKVESLRVLDLGHGAFKLSHLFFRRGQLGGETLELVLQPLAIGHVPEDTLSPDNLAVAVEDGPFDDLHVKLLSLGGQVLF